MMQDIPIIDSDSHVSEPPDLWTSRLPKKWIDQGPRTVWDEKLGGLRWLIGDQRLQSVTSFSQAGWSEFPPKRPKRIEETDPGCYDPHVRLERLDEYGIYAQVLYPNILGFFPQAFIALKDPKLALACVSAYNDFLTEFAEADPNRLLPITMLPFWDKKAAVAELHRAADAGHRGVLLAGNYDRIGLDNIWEPTWEPLLKAIEERSLSVNFHIGFGEVDDDAMVERLKGMNGDDFTRMAVPSFLNNVRVMGDIVCTGLCQKYPLLNFVSVESGAGFFPFMMEALDWQWKNHGTHYDHPDWELPSYYVRRQIFGSYWFERDSINSIIELIPDNIMFETDYPHPVGLAPGPASYADNPRKMAEASMEGISEETVRKVFFETAARLYKVDTPSEEQIAV